MMCLCLKCFNEINKTKFLYKDVDCNMDFCDKCGKNTDCVVGIHQDLQQQETEED